MRTIHILSGLQGSGKTTYMKAHAAEGDRYLSRDDVRSQIREEKECKEYFPLSAKDEMKAWCFAAASVLLAHPESNDFWFDATFLTVDSINKFLEGVQSCLIEANIRIAEFNIIIEKMNVPLDECLHRNLERTGFARVPSDVIKRMAKIRPLTEKEIQDRGVYKMTLHEVDNSHPYEEPTKVLMPKH